MPLPVERSTKLWLALLLEIDRAGGAAGPGALYPKVRAHFPEISDADAAHVHKTGSNSWANRVQWARNLLAQRGCIARGERGSWPITPLGKRWLDTHWRGDDADYAAILQPPVLEALERTHADRGAPTERPAPDETWPRPRPTTGALDIGLRAESLFQPPSSGEVALAPTAPSVIEGSAAIPPKAQTAPSPLSPMVNPIDQLCHYLEESQRQSGVPRLFEQHLTEAFATLGFTATHIGGSGETDVFVQADLGPRSYSAVIDAKTTRNGKVIDSQINFHAIEAHRQGRAADFTVVVGVDFSNGQVQTFADQSKVTLLTTGMLIELLRLHDRIPFTLLELKDLFTTSGRAEASMQVLRERHQQHARHWELLAKIIDTIGRYAPPKVDNLWYVLLAQTQSSDRSPTTAPTLDDVIAAVNFLSSRAIHVIEEVPGSNGAYQLVVSPRVARQRLTALARFTSAKHADMG